jgi:hypothetical protein
MSEFIKDYDDYKLRKFCAQCASRSKNERPPHVNANDLYLFITGQMKPLRYGADLQADK